MVLALIKIKFFRTPLCTASTALLLRPPRTSPQLTVSPSPLVLGVPTVRDRCDSLPSRARTTSESQGSGGGGGNSCVVPATVIAVPSPAVAPHPRPAQVTAAHCLMAPHVARPHSMHSRVILSYSPPVASMPISPASAACSTDSAGSSLSMDDASENIMEEGVLAKYGHSLTPDEPVILEENGDDYVPWSAGHQQKYSPNFKSCSPSQVSNAAGCWGRCCLMKDDCVCPAVMVRFRRVRKEWRVRLHRF